MMTIVEFFFVLCNKGWSLKFVHSVFAYLLASCNYFVDFLITNCR